MITPCGGFPVSVGAEEAGTISPEEIIAEACKLPLPALERVAWILGFEVLGRMQEPGEAEELGRAWQ